MIRYEQITECAPGRDSGRGSDIRMAEFLKEALVRRYGEPWYAEFLSECLRRDPSAIRGPAEERA
jgi:hypothetical protein